jgi:GNAT superfamily N-acetyltransferase
MDFTLTVTDVADEEVRKAILTPFVAYNESKAGPGHGRPLVVLIRNQADETVGGLWGATGYGWLFTQLLVVPANMRGQGIGTKVMQFGEREAVSRGCHSAWLDTFEFQARTFYERIGYECFGELPNYPLGFARFFMKKVL